MNTVNWEQVLRGIKEAIEFEVKTWKPELQITA